VVVQGGGIIEEGGGFSGPPSILVKNFAEWQFASWQR